MSLGSLGISTTDLGHINTWKWTLLKEAGLSGSICPHGGGFAPAVAATAGSCAGPPDVPHHPHAEVRMGGHLFGGIWGHTHSHGGFLSHRGAPNHPFKWDFP